jgi:hypothetical protein
MEPNNRIATLKKKRDQLTAQIKAAQSKEQNHARKEDTRRKIIIGAVARNHADMHPDSPFATELQTLLEKYVTTQKERALLGLSPLTPHKKTGT